MFTNTAKSNQEAETAFTSADSIDKKIEITTPPNSASVEVSNSPKFIEGLLSIGSSPLFNEDECKKIINGCIEELWTPVKVYGTGNIHQASMQRVRGNLSELPFSLLREAVVSANTEIYKFNILGMLDTDYPQVARYKKGDFYNFHTEINPMSTTRKLSFIIMLNDPSEYEGGEIEFLNTELAHSETSKIGTMIVFPSFLCYRMKPVKKGIRYVVTGSIHGDSFK
jgi:hypothetical protein